MEKVWGDRVRKYFIVIGYDLFGSDELKDFIALLFIVVCIHQIMLVFFTPFYVILRK